MRLPEHIAKKINEIVDAYPVIDFSEGDVVICMMRLAEYILTTQENKQEQENG